MQYLGGLKMAKAFTEEEKIKIKEDIMETALICFTKKEKNHFVFQN